MKLKFNWTRKEPKEAQPPKAAVEIPLLEELSLDPVERSLLANLIRDPGFAVFIKIMNAVCYEATKKLVSVDVANPSEVVARHLEARAKNDFCFRLIALVRQFAGANATQSTRDNPTEKNDARSSTGIHTRNTAAN